jgi:proline dehydrogenase
MDLARRSLLWFADRRNAQRVISGAPVTRRVARRFVAGERTEDAIEVLRRLREQGLGGILNLLGESVTDANEAEAATAAYEEAISAAAGEHLSTAVTIKLTQLGLLFDPQGCLRRLQRIGARAASTSLGLEVDMEQAEHVAATLDMYKSSGLEPLPRIAVQAYLHRTPQDVGDLNARQARVRLVKGAYLEPASVALQDHSAISRRFAELSTTLLAGGTDPAFATHDTVLIVHVLREARRLRRGPADYEFQFLYGIRRDLQQRLAKRGFRVRVYVPFGSAWYAYLVRRLAERPANLRFFARALVGG